MPVFEIGLDDGRKLQIDADSQEAALAGVQHFLGQPTSSEPSGAAAGLAHGAQAAENSVKATAKNYLGLGSGPEPTDPNYVPAQVVDTHGSYNPLKWDVHADQIPQKIAEEAPGLAQHITAATLGAKLGGKVGGLKGAALGGLIGGAGSMWASSAGDAAKADAVARTGDPNAEPNASDLTRAGLTSAASSAVQAVLPTRFIPGANKVAAVGAQGALQGIKKYLATTALGGATSAAGNVIDQAGNSIGTDQGLTVDPNKVADAAIGGAATAGVMGAPRGIADVARAARRAEFGGANQAATEAVANRLAQNAGSDGLGGVFNGKRDFRAMEATQKGLRNELQAIDDSGFNQDQQNAISLARGGSRLTPEHVDAIGAADPAAGHLANQLRMSQLMTDFGSYDRTNGVWSGGVSGKMDKLMRNYVDPTKVAVGAAAGKVMGLHLLGTASPAFAGAAAGTYGLARMADAMTGARSPAASFAEQFQNAQANTRLVPTNQQAQQQQQAQSVQQAQLQQAQAGQPIQGTPQPWGPVPPSAGPTGPQVAPPPGPKPPITPGTLPWKAPTVTPQPTAAEQLDAAAKGVQAMLKQRAYLDKVRKNSTTEEPAAAPEAPAAPTEADQLGAATKAMQAMLKQRAWLAKVQANSTPPEQPQAAPQQPPAPPPQAPVDPLRLPADVTAPARNMMKGEALKARLLAANTPKPEAAPAVKITKTNGGAVQTTPVPQTLHAAVTPPGPQPTDFYRPLDPSEMRFQGRSPSFIADTLSRERMAGKPQEVIDNYRKSVLDTHSERRQIVQAVIERNPLDAPKLRELIDQLHERGKRDQGMAAVRHYAKLVSPQAAGDLLSGFNDAAAQRIWATSAEKKAARAALKKKHTTKNENQSAGT
ncbi:MULTISPECIES: hypothetical protein [unclassified Bradyrhizobium]|uniref:hypothetical protein n=1 Tax=unclassified Bradyrhizobium TaxID=2631580 RepID=UPI002916FF21|nr:MULTISPECIES: hypothetical protein [unclassified Bradyrhizobium]